MNKVFPNDPQLNFYLEFTDDVAELRAAEEDRDDDQAAGANPFSSGRQPQRGRFRRWLG